MAFTHYSPHTVNSGQCPSILTDFPVPVIKTDDRFKTIANGGKVANASGFDIRPYSNAGLTSALTYQLQFYDGTTGTVVMRVKDTVGDGLVTYLAYGDAALTTDGSSTAVWNSGFKGAWGLKDGTTLSLLDGTAEGNDGTNNGATAVAGKVDGAANFDGTQDVNVGNDASLQITGQITLEAWVNVTTFPVNNGDFGTIIGKGYDGSTESYFLRLRKQPTTGILNLSVGSFDGVTAFFTDWDISGWNTGEWHHVVGLWDGTDWKLYFDGTEVSSDAHASGAIAGTKDAYLAASDISGTVSRRIIAKLDEVRIHNTGRTADWILTTYRSEFAPNTFATLGTEVALEEKPWLYRNHSKVASIYA